VCVVIRVFPGLSLVRLAKPGMPLGHVDARTCVSHWTVSGLIMCFLTDSRGD